MDFLKSKLKIGKLTSSDSPINSFDTGKVFEPKNSPMRLSEVVKYFLANPEICLEE
jgi:hypothetical protein